MRNNVQKGNVVPLTAPYAVSSGGGCKVGHVFGVATSDVASGAVGEFDTRGVKNVTALTTDTFSQGDLVYWDDTNKRCTSTATSNSLIGAALVAKTSGQTTVTVRLNGVSI